MEPQEDQPSYFEKHGIEENASKSSLNLFEEIKQLVHNHITKGGHDYTPNHLEYRASSIGTCSRKIQLQNNLDFYLNKDEIIALPQWYKDQISDDDTINFGAHISGQVVHEVIQDALKDRMLSMEEEVTYTVGDATLKGHYDLLMEFDDGKKVVIDIKSTRTPRRYLPNQKHLRQLMAYQGMLGGIEGGLLYVDRNNFEMSYVSQPFSSEEFNKIIIKISQLASYDKQQKLSPPIPEYDQECITEYFTCQFYNYCFPEN